MEVSFYIPPYIYSPMALIFLTLILYFIIDLIVRERMWSTEYDIKQINKRVDSHTKQIQELGKR